MRAILFTLALMFGIGGTFPAFASEVSVQETDMFGNPIDWDTNGAGNEDGAGEETETIAETVPEYAFGEQAGVIEEKESIEAETTAPSQNGYITVSAETDGKEWSEGNILVTLYRDGNQKEEIWLYRQNSFSERAELPAGHYTFASAKTASGEEFSANPGTFDITETSPVTIKLTLGVDKPTVSVPDVESSEKVEETVKNQESHIYIWGGVVALGCILGGLSWFAKKRRRSRDYKNDLLD